MADAAPRPLAAARPDQGASFVFGVDTYTVKATGQQTGGRYALLDMFVPPGGGPPPHAHTFDEGFWVLEGEVLVLCGNRELRAGPGGFVNIPADAPHRFHNDGQVPARLLGVVAPAGLERFFERTGVPVAGPTVAAPPANAAEQAERKRVAGEYGITFLPEDYFDHRPTRPTEDAP